MKARVTVSRTAQTRAQGQRGAACRETGASHRSHQALSSRTRGVKNLQLVQSKRQSSSVSTTPTQKRKVVVLGCGWAGFRFVKNIDQRYYDVTVISPKNHFVFTPLLASTAVGTLEFRTVIEPVRSVKGIKYFQAQANAVDAANKSVECSSVFSYENNTPAKFSIPYDDLVIAVGGENQTFGVPGVKDHTKFLKTVEQARNIRLRILECFEEASEPTTSVVQKQNLLHFVIVGGGATGVEFGAELSDFIHEDVKKSFPEVAKYARITLLEAGVAVLSAFDKRLSKYAVKQLREEDLQIRTNIRVKEIQEGKILLETGEVIPFGMCLWSTGIVPPKFIQELTWAKNKRGRLLVGPDLQMEDKPDVYGLGDCAVSEIKELPQTAQAAVQQAKYLAKAFNDRAKGNKVTPFVYQYRGMLAYVGGYHAVSDFPGPFKVKGYISWLLWRSAYFTTLVSVSNKILVPMYWFKSFLFGRDVSRF